MTRRFLLAALAIAVAVGLAFLIVSATSSGGSDSSTAQSDGSGIVPEAQAADQPKLAAPGGAGVSPTNDGVAPGLPGAAPQVEADHTEHIRNDGTLVRDHRSGNPEPPDPEVSPFVRPTRAAVAPDAIVAVRHALRPGVRRCSAAYAADVGQDARVRVRLQVSITGGQVTVAKTDIKAVNVDQNDLAACVEQAARNMELTVEHEDVEHHMLTFPFRLPLK